MSEFPPTRKEFERLDHQVNGNGQPGVVQLVQGIKEDIAGMVATEEERKVQEAKHHRANVLRLNVIIALTGIAALIVSAAAIWVSVLLTHRASVDPFSVFGPPHSAELAARY